MNSNPLRQEVRANPYPYYAYLHEHAPVHWIEPLQGWALSRSADVDFALRNPQIFSSASWVSTISRREDQIKRNFPLFTHARFGAIPVAFGTRTAYQ
jgi:cytochrome P450